MTQTHMCPASMAWYTGSAPDVKAFYKMRKGAVRCAILLCMLGGSLPHSLCLEPAAWAGNQVCQGLLPFSQTGLRPSQYPLYIVTPLVLGCSCELALPKATLQQRYAVGVMVHGHGHFRWHKTHQNISVAVDT